MKKNKVRSLIWFSISILALLLVAPTHLSLLAWSGRDLVEMPYSPSGFIVPDTSSADLDGDGLSEEIILQDGGVEIRNTDLVVWDSPSEWQVVQARITDLNHDHKPEVALLVWRAFSPWPIDAYLPHPGRIQDFHDRNDQSCHFILIGWRGEAYGELWAGSALADPILSFTTADLDLDGWQELIALESKYDAVFENDCAITIWEWNGFGFTLLSRGPRGLFHSITTAQTPSGQEILLAQGILWR
jgi:hypothetical protein